MKPTPEAFRQYLAEQFEAQTFSVGDRLPPERHWAEKFNISRGSVRRILKLFEDDGRIRRVSGSGTFVLPAASQEKTAPAHASPAELLEARLYLEPALAEMIVRNAHTEDFAAMRQCLKRESGKLSAEEFDDMETGLLQVFAAATHNALIVQAMSHMGEAKRNGGWQSLRKRRHTHETRQRQINQLEQVIDALAQRDLQRSRELMVRYVYGLREDLFGS